jgi:hypothetical protein
MGYFRLIFSPVGWRTFESTAWGGCLGLAWQLESPANAAKNRLFIDFHGFFF